MKLLFDVLVITKDRTEYAVNIIERIKKNIPYNKIIVVESSVNPFFEKLEKKDVILIHTPNVTRGYARKRGIEKVTTPYFFCFDDDIVFFKDYWRKMYNAIKKNNKNCGVSSSIIHTLNKDIIIAWKSLKQRGSSSGICIMNKEIYDKVGGYDENIHVGEDAELSARIYASGYLWSKCNTVYAYHLSTKKEFIFRRWKHRKGIWYTLRYGRYKLLNLMMRRLGGMLIVPLKTLVKTRNIKSYLYMQIFYIVEVINSLVALKDVKRFFE